MALVFLFVSLPGYYDKLQKQITNRKAAVLYSCAFISARVVFCNPHS